MKLSKVLKLKPGMKVMLKRSRDKFSNHRDKHDPMLIPGRVVIIDVIDNGDTDLQIGAHYEGCTTSTARGPQLWINHDSVKEVEGELLGSE